jgi:hypothetical protein
MNSLSRKKQLSKMTCRHGKTKTSGAADADKLLRGAYRHSQEILRRYLTGIRRIGLKDDLVCARL